MIDGIKDVEIDDLRFQLVKMKGMKAFLLDRKIIIMLLPVIGGFKNLDSEIDFKVISEGVQDALLKMSDTEYKSLVLDLLKEVTVRPVDPKPGEAESLPMTEPVIDTHFSGKMITLYKLIIEVMRFNKFSPFEMVAGGMKMNQIVSFVGQKKKEKKTGK